MSGGYFNDQQYQFGLIADEIPQIVDTNESDETNRWGDTVGRGYEPATIAEFRHCIAHLRLAAIYTQRIDYLVSGDDGEESFHRRLQHDLQADLATGAGSSPE
jgi:hypothetical protein